MAGAVEAAGTDQRRIEIFYIVGRSEHDDACARREAVELDQHGIDDAVILRLASRVAAAALAQPIDLVDENNARRLFARERKQLSDAAHADAEEHIGEVAAREPYERHARLARHRAREQRLARAVMAFEHRPLGRLAAKLGDFTRIFKIR